MTSVFVSSLRSVPIGRESIRAKNIKKTMLRGIKGCMLNNYPEKTACMFFQNPLSKKDACADKGE